MKRRRAWIVLKISQTRQPKLCVVGRMFDGDPRWPSEFGRGAKGRFSDMMHLLLQAVFELGDLVGDFLRVGARIVRAAGAAQEDRLAVNLDAVWFTHEPERSTVVRTCFKTGSC